jgi:hypothetical protein
MTPSLLDLYGVAYSAPTAENRGTSRRDKALYKAIYFTYLDTIEKVRQHANDRTGTYLVQGE